MLDMKKDGKPLSHGLILGRNGRLEQVVLNVLRQITPEPDNSLTQSAEKLLLNLGGEFVHAGLHLHGK
jgi:hypothetical protein